MAARYPAAAAKPAVHGHGEHGRAVPVRMARASRLVDDAAKTAQPKRAPSNSKAATSVEDDEVDDDDANQSELSGVMDYGDDEESHGDPRHLFHQQQVLFFFCGCFFFLHIL